MGRRLLPLLLLAVLSALSGCGPNDPEGGELTVLAAASLTDVFTELGAAFEAASDGVTVRFGFAGSQQLATQVLEGAPADVFAPAATTHMDQVAAAGRVAGDVRVFAASRLAIAVEPGNPLGIAGVADLADPGLTLVLAAEEVPAGRYARQLLERAGVRARPDSLEADVRAVLSKVALGEADAGLVYLPDVLAAADAVGHVTIPDELEVTATYPIASLADAPAPDLAAAFVRYVLSDAGQATLAEHGFASAPSPTP